jgi:hypothetical protein
MIAAFIVISSIILAAVFTVAWIIKPGFREQVENPKYSFQAQLERYNRQCQDKQDAVTGGSNES